MINIHPFWLGIYIACEPQMYFGRRFSPSKNDRNMSAVRRVRLQSFIQFYLLYVRRHVFGIDFLIARLLSCKESITLQGASGELSESLKM